MSGRLGAVISPYVVELGPLTGLSWLPMAVFAAVSILRQGSYNFLKLGDLGYIALHDADLFFFYLADFISKLCLWIFHDPSHTCVVDLNLDKFRI
jgi:hypothetical protein